ncbi:hypothetical protein [Streptomyces erythrochromogenes]|uniref:hypothetical protein n=1 Tax=Streptomyces erythrochromogenes TaxID=285574 RepID=UPI00369879DB
MLLYSNTSGAVRWSGGLTVLSVGSSIDEEHPLALERPDLFTGSQPQPDIKMPPAARPRRAVPVVESATRAPGETRGASTRGRGKRGAGRGTANAPAADDDTTEDTGAEDTGTPAGEGTAGE